MIFFFKKNYKNLDLEWYLSQYQWSGVIPQGRLKIQSLTMISERGVTPFLPLSSLYRGGRGHTPKWN